MTTPTIIPPKDAILSTFDDLVAAGTIFFSPHRTIKHDADGYPLEFRICPAFSRKPHHIGAKLNATHSNHQQWGPGSDLFCPDPRMKLAQLNGTHDLAFNMFCTDRPQFLILTLDSYRRQYELLDAADFQAALDMLCIPGLGAELYMIFNGGEAAGCSREHKHLQGLRGPPPAFSHFVEEELRRTVPFQFFAHHFLSGFAGVTGEQMVRVYASLIEQAKETLGLPKSAIVVPHGAFMWKDWLVVIPRRKSGIEGTRASAATAGMMGSVWLSEDGPVEDWVKLGLREVLGELGVPP
ncbi:hypothetical protein PMIN03_008504 [Paraphaeosphaeria minitans]